MASRPSTGEGGEEAGRIDPADDTSDAYAVFTRTYRSAPATRPRRRARLFVVAALAGLVIWASRPPAEPVASRVAVPDAIPTSRPAAPPAALHAPTKVSLRVGEEREFGVTDPALRYAWTLDGRPVGTDARWTWVPRPDEVGRRRVDVVATGSEGSEQRHWAVRVKPAPPPRLLLVEPAQATIEIASAGQLDLHVEAEPATRGERLHTTWLVDGVAAAEGPTFAFRAPEPGVTVIRAQVQSDLGPAIRLAWRVNVLPRVEPDPVPNAAARTPEPPRSALTDAGRPPPHVTPPRSSRPERPMAGRPAAPTAREAAPRGEAAASPAPLTAEDEVRQ